MTAFFTEFYAWLKTPNPNEIANFEAFEEYRTSPAAYIAKVKALTLASLSDNPPTFKPQTVTWGSKMPMVAIAK